MSECKHPKSPWPAIGAKRPDHYLNWVNDLPEENIIADDDYCMIKHEDQTDHFIRAVCIQKLKNSDQTFHYGPWVSVGEETLLKIISLQEGEENQVNVPLGLGFWCTNFPWYPDMHLIPCKIFFSGKTTRPILEPDAQFDHPFVLDFYNGIEIEEIHARMKMMEEGFRKAGK